MNLEKKDEKQLQKFLSLSTQDKSYEFEIIFKNTNKKSITGNIFKRVATKLNQSKLNRIDVNPTLEIFLDQENVRVSIIGKSNIYKYKVSNDINNLSPESLLFMKKKIVFDKNGNKVSNYNLDDYNLRAKIKYEYDLKTNEDHVNKIKKEWKNYRKSYRYKTRFSYVDSSNLFSIDLTVVKSSSNKEGEILYYKKVSDSNLFTNPQEYEIELEFIGNKKKSVDLALSYREMIKYMTIIIKCIQNCKYILSNSLKESLLDNYVKTITQKTRESSISNKLYKSHGGIGPKVVSLEISHLIEQTPEIMNKYFKNSHLPSIRLDYSVVEKTDGERQFIFISDDGKAYLIDHMMEFKGTDIQFDNFRNCILDGEYVTKDKNKRNINHFLIFDCYFINGEDVRNLPLYTPDKEIKLESRLDCIKKIIKEFKKIDKKEPLKYKLILKDYKFGDINEPGMSIFKKCSDIWKNVHQERYPYEIDGLIFTPIKLPVGGKYDKNDKFYSGKAWNQLFKWKSPKDNTIDFLVKIQKQNGEDKIGYKKVNDELKKYKTLLLFVGSHSNTQKVDPYDLLCAPKIDTEPLGNYVAREFIPEDPVDPEAYIAHILLDVVNGKEEMRPLKGGVIKDNTIVEMSYDIDKDRYWRWTPRNIRYDKTELFHRGDNQFGNNYNTANNIWRSYYNPITENMILRGQDIPETPMDNSKIYYHHEVNKRVNSPLKSMRDFHNLYVKNRLYECTSNMFKQGSLLELACGKGGDLSRWFKYELSPVVGIDLYKDNIENKKDGAIKRFLDNKQKYDSLEKVYFLVGDCSRNIMNGDFTDGFYKNIYNILWNSDRSIETNREVEENSYGLSKSGFDIISCQFALHYFFKNPETLNSFITNLVENIKEDGYFIGTCFDGKTIFNSLKDINFKDKIECDIEGIPLWSIKKNYQVNKLSDDEKSLGLEISVFIASIGDYQSEYLVNFDYFCKLMGKNGFSLLQLDDNTNFNFPIGDNGTSSGMFDKLYNTMLSETHSGILNNNRLGNAVYLENQPEIQKYSFFNRWFIFKRNKTKK